MEGGSVDELLDMTVERPGLDQLQVEVGRTPDSSLSRATTSTASPLTIVASGQSSGASSVDDTTVAGMFLIRVTQASRTSDSSVLSASICTNCRNVVAPNTIRCSWPNEAR